MIPLANEDAAAFGLPARTTMVGSNGIAKALEKLPISHEKIEEMIDGIEEKIRRTGKEEVETTLIGEYVMETLKEVDQVAYIRFASVYRQFTDVTSFEKEVKNLTEK